jgi:hypothetical protein
MSIPKEKCMQYLVAVFLVISILSGCASPKVGGYYKADLHNSVSPDTANIFLYIDENVDSSIYYYVYLDDIEKGKLFKSTYLIISASVGTHNLKVTEWLSGEGVGNALSLSTMFENLSKDTATTWPETLQAGKSTSLKIDALSTDNMFLRIGKKIGKELFYECEITDETTTICSKQYFDSHLELIPTKQAQDELAILKESLK